VATADTQTALLEEIARRVGVSTRTVCRALSGEAKGLYGPASARIQRIKAVADEVGYRPYSAAKAVVSGRFGCLALVTSDQPGRDYLSPDTLRGIQRSLADRDMHLSVACLSEERIRDDDSQPKVLREWLADGLMINYSATVPPALEALAAHRERPAIWINTQRGHDAIHPDDHQAGCAAAEALLQRGHRRLAYAAFRRWSESTGHYSIAARRAGFMSAVTAAGLPLRELPGDDRHGDEANIALLRAVLSAADRPTAIVCYNLHDLRSIRDVAVRIGLRVPEDLSLIAIDDHPGDDWGQPASAMLLDAEALGNEAVAMCLRKCSSGRRQRTKALPYSLRLGATMAPVV
jgi:LacI family transcriptional regulator